jgi:hypothetical protein
MLLDLLAHDILSHIVNKGDLNVLMLRLVSKKFKELVETDTDCNVVVGLNKCHISPDQYKATLCIFAQHANIDLSVIEFGKSRSCNTAMERFLIALVGLKNDSMVWPNITHFTLIEAPLSTTNIALLAFGRTFLQRLTSLVLVDNDIEASSTTSQVLNSALMGISNLTLLHIEHNYALSVPQYFQPFCTLIRNSKNLRHLILVDNHHSDVAVPFLMRAVQVRRPSGGVLQSVYATKKLTPSL